MSNPIIFDGTGHRQMTDDEYEQHQQLVAEIKAQKEQQAAFAANQKALLESGRAKLKALGLTDDEVAALIP